MFDYLKKNKEWLFSGIGIFVLVAGFTFLKNCFYQKEKSNEVLPKTEIAELSKVKPWELNAHEIIKKINALPPLQRETMSKHFYGISVNWDVIFQGARKNVKDENYIILLLTVPRDKKYIRSAFVTCVVQVGEYPKLNIMKEGTIINIKGIIRYIEGSQIWLRDVQLLF